MRLGVVTTSFPRFEGDFAGSFVGEHVEWLRSRGHQVDVIAADDSEAAPLPGVRRVPGPTGLFYAGGAPDVLSNRPGLGLAAVPFAARMAAAVLAARHWDGVIAHWLIPGAIAAAMAPRTPLTAIAHSGDVDLLCRTGLAGPVAALMVARRARVVFVANHLRSRFAASVPTYLRHAVESAAVVPMGVDVERFRTPAHGRGRRVVFMGRLVPIKGVHLLLDALPELTSFAEVVIAGGGPLEDQVAARARESGAEFRHWVRGAERDRLLASARVVVMPSMDIEGRVEGLPVTALETMAAGAALVATPSGGLAELPAETVSWMSAPTCAALCAAVRGMLENEVDRVRQVEAALNFVRSMDWSCVGPELMPPDRP